MLCFLTFQCVNIAIKSQGALSVHWGGATEPRGFHCRFCLGRQNPHEENYLEWKEGQETILLCYFIGIVVLPHDHPRSTTHNPQPMTHNPMILVILVHGGILVHVVGRGWYVLGCRLLVVGVILGPTIHLQSHSQILVQDTIKYIIAADIFVTSQEIIFILRHSYVYSGPSVIPIAQFDLKK